MINRQFYVMKFQSSKLKKFNYNYNISFSEAKENKEIVALADNQILRSIRDICKYPVDLLDIEELYQARDKLKKLSGNHADEIQQIQNQINHLMFIPEYITVVMEHPKHYEYIYQNGIVINGVKYKRFSCSAGQARISTVALCSETIIDELKERLDNGRDKSVPLAPSKYNAYFGLSGSATFKVSEPKFIVVKDFSNTTKYMTNFVTETDWKIDDTIDQREIELEMNRTDGMGLISPRQAKIWADDIGLDYIPSQFIIRQSFMKGLLCTFDIHKFCEEKNGGNYIVDTIYKDKDGNYIKADLRDYDVIISESQFKLWNAYPNVETYIDNYRKNKLYWGVAQYAPKEAKDILKLNYQFIQTLNLNEEDIEKLASQFVDWISGVTYKNLPYTLLFLLGVNNTEENIKEYLQKSDTYWIKSLILNPKLIHDKYITSKIYDLIKIRIKNGCLGSIIVDGNFQYIVSDPYGFMQSVCGQEVTGLLKQGEYYSNYWNKKNVKQVDSMRSPLTYRSEHVILNFRNDEETHEWYKYCNLGIIINYYGHEVCNWGGADMDGDIVATTSNPTMIKGVYHDELTVTYEPPKPKKIVFTEDDLYKSDVFSFGSIIGSITNKGSIAYTMLPNIEEQYGRDSDEAKLLISRLQQCCKAQSAQIDKAKIGREVKGIPDVWVNHQAPRVDDNGEVISTEEELKYIDTCNHVLLTKKPYYFRYLYDNTRKDYNDYVNKANMNCKDKFHMTISELEDLKRKTIEQKEFLNNYYNYMPVIISKSPMNSLCYYIESINFDIKNNLRITNQSDIYKQYMNNDFDFDQEKYNKVIEAVNNFTKTSRSFWVSEKNKSSYNDDIKETVPFSFYTEKLERDLTEISSNVYDITNYLVRYFYEYKPSSNKDVLWSMYGKYMFHNIKQNSHGKCYFPFPDVNGEIVYLGKKYSLKEVKL